LWRSTPTIRAGKWPPAFGPRDPSSRARREGAAALAARRLGSRRSPCRRKPVRPSTLEPIEGAIAEATQGRDVVGQEHKAERQHPEAEDREEGEAPPDDQQYAGGDARPARSGFPQPPGYGLHPARQAAEEPSQPPLRIGVGEIIGRGYGLRVQAPEIGSRVAPRNPYFSLCRDQSSASQARSTALAAASRASTIAWICSGFASRPRRRS
jgi:hypothetical protein